MLRLFPRLGLREVHYNVFYSCISLRWGGTDSVTFGKSELPENKKTLQGKRFAFVNDLFIGKYDHGILAFPEVLDRERLKTLDTRINLVESFFKLEVNSQQIDLENHISEIVLDGLGKLGLFGMRAPLSSCGMELNATEYACLKEVIAQDGSIAELLDLHEGQGLQSLLLSSNPGMNPGYIKDLASGKLIAAVCLSENNDETDMSSIMTSAELSEDGTHWVLNGTKKWVNNASSAGIFIVAARSGKMGELTVFLVEKNFPGVTVKSSCHKLGLRGTTLSEVSFKNTCIPHSNVLSDVNLGALFIHDVLTANMYAYGSSGTALMKKLLKLAAEYSVSTKYFGKYLNNCKSIQCKVANACSRIYAMESLTYLTAGLLDSGDNVDCVNESAIVKIYSSEIVVRSMDECQDIFGPNAFKKKFPYEQLLRDSWSRTVPEVSNISLRISLILSGLQYAGFTYPATSRRPLRKFYERWCQDHDQPVLDLKLPDYVHPSLEIPAKQLEYCVKRFQYALEILLAKYGTHIVEHEEQLCRLADILINIYVMTAVIGRASRSYCIGLQYSDQEILIASGIVSHAHTEVKRTVNDIIHVPESKFDPNFVEITKKIFESKGFMPFNL